MKPTWIPHTDTHHNHKRLFLYTINGQLVICHNSFNWAEHAEKFHSNLVEIMTTLLPLEFFSKWFFEYIHKFISDTERFLTQNKKNFEGG